MRALTFTAPAQDRSRTVVQEVPEPLPGAHQIAVGVEYAGVNFKDVMSRRGDPGYVTSWPFVPGLEVAGTVRAVGSAVTTFAIGDRVVAYTGAGGMAEVAIADAALAVMMPQGVDEAVAGAAIGVLVTARLLLTANGRVAQGDRVLVHGAAGGVGAAVAALARLLEVGGLIGTVGSANRVEQARRLGYDAVLVRDSALAAQVHALGFEGVDLVLDPQGTSLLESDLDLLVPGGRVVIFGNAGGDALEALPPLSSLMGRNASIGGFSLAALAARAPSKLARALSSTLGDLAASALSLPVESINGLESAPTAQQALADGQGTGKYVVHVTA